MSPWATLLGVERVVGPVRFPAAPPAWAIVVLLAALAIGVRWIYRRERQKVSRGWRIVLGGLRILAVAIVALALFQPQREVAEVVQDKSHLVLLLDTSSSMTTVDRYKPEDEQRILAAAFPEGGSDGRPSRLALSRGEILQRVVAGPTEPVLRALADRFVLHVYGFDEDVRLVGSTERAGDGGRPGTGTDDGDAEGARRPSDPASLGEAVRNLKFEGPSTSVGGALRALAREFVGRDDRRLAGVVVVTDGRDNAEGERPLDAVAALGKGAEDLRVSAVGLGDPRLAKNLRVDKILAKDEVLVQDEVTFLAQLRQTGFDGVEDVQVELEITQVKGPDHRDLERPRLITPKGEGARRASTRVRLLPAAQPTAASLGALFEEAGDYEVKVRARLPRTPHDYAAEDAVMEDDEKVHHLRVLDRTIKVLVVDREMRYETHFLKNVLVRESRHPGDPKRVDAQVFVQSFDPEVPQPAGRAVTPLKVFPSTRQELFAYDVIVFGDVNWRKLGATEERSKEILRILKDFVAEGGGMAFVAGETANPTQYLDTPLQDLLPVIVRPSDRSDELPKTQAFRLAPTDVGREHPILSVLQTDPERVDRIWREREGWEWYWLYRARGGLKPGAFALARVWNAPGREFTDDRGDPYAVFAGMGYGKGRVFFSALDQISRIRMSVADVYYGPFWDETIRWLATYRLRGGNARYKIETDKEAYFVGETAVVKVWAFDRDFKPVRADTLRGLQLEGPDGKPMLTDAEAARKDPDGAEGLYRTSVRLATGGTYLVYVDPPDRDAGARAEHRFVARFATKEAQDKVPDHDLLAAVGKATNPPGPADRTFVFAPWQLRALVDGLESRLTPRQLSRRDEPLWDNGWPLALATAILALEWILRKRFQMI